MRGNDRRDFLKKILTLSVFSKVSPHILKGEETPVIHIDENILSTVYELELAQYPELLEEWGSVLITVQNIAKEFPEQYYVTRVPKDVDPSSFTVVSNICPHEYVMLYELNHIDHNFYCPLHEGRYEVTGKYIEGPLEGVNLTRYYCDTWNEGDKYLRINFDFEIKGSRVLDINSYVKINYPNPFKAKTSIIYGIAEDSYINYEIYDFKNSIIIQSAQTFKSAGEYTENIDLSDFPNGVYFFKLYINGKNYNSLKMIKIG